MKETSKNYEDRILNGDFKNYLHGKGIDIGGGDDPLVLPENIEGSCRLWDFQDGDAQYLHKIPDESFDFVYSSHCLEHMRNLEIALTNWLRVCKTGGYLYICVPHEKYYEKEIWPSQYNPDHKHSFTVDEKGTLPNNVVVKEFLEGFSEWIQIIDIRENLKNYRFDVDASVDQTFNYKDKVCAQIDFIIKKNQMKLSQEWHKENNKNFMRDYCSIILPIRLHSLKVFLLGKKGKREYPR